MPSELLCSFGSNAVAVLYAVNVLLSNDLATLPK